MKHWMMVVAVFATMSWTGAQAIPSWIGVYGSCQPRMLCTAHDSRFVGDTVVFHHLFDPIASGYRVAFSPMTGLGHFIP